MISEDNILTKSIRLLHYYPRTILWLVTRLVFATFIITALILAVNPVYKASSKITTLPSQSEINYAESRFDVAAAFGPAMLLGQTHTEYLLSRSLAEKVAERMIEEGVRNGSESWLKKITIKPVMWTLRTIYGLVNYARVGAADCRDTFVGRIQENTKVNNVPGSFVLEVEVEWDDPEIAATTANLMTDIFAEITRKDNQSEMRATRKYINERIEEAEYDLAEVERRIEEFKKTRGLYLGREDAVLQLDLFTGSLKDYNRVRERVEALNKKYDVLEDYSTPGAIASIEAEIAGLNARREILEKNLQAQLSDLKAYPGNEKELLILNRRRVEKEKSLLTLQESLLKTKIAEASQLSSVRVIDRAVPPVFPAGPSLITNCLIAFLVGLVVCAGHISLSEHFHKYVRTKENLGDLGNRLIGLVPYNPPWLEEKELTGRTGAGFGDRGREKEAYSQRLIWSAQARMAYFSRGGHKDHATALSEIRSRHEKVFNRHIDHLLENLASGDIRGRVIIFSSIYEGRGKSYIVEALARRAGYSGKRLLLVDSNGASPKLHNIFGVPLNKGLTDLIIGEPDIQLKDLIREVDPNIDIVSAGSIALDGKQKWFVDRVARQLGEVRENYDLILMDTASLKVDPLVRRLWPLSDEMVCVVDANTCTQGDLDDLHERTNGYSKHVGFVLNNVRYRGDYLYDS